jgi:hypothetical protein
MMHAPVGDPQTPSDSEVRAALDRVCTSKPFAASRRLISFLRFAVETTLDGHGDRLKGYTIGVEALGRAPEFDPQIDPIVRVEAGRMRRALARYYADVGALDPVVIDVPVGRYAPLFSRRKVHMLQLLHWRRALRALKAMMHS